MKHLRELLTEEQEPFALDTYIDERRFQLRKPKRKPPPPPFPSPFQTTTTSSSPKLSSKTTLLFSPSTYVKKSPLFDLTSNNTSAASRAAACLLLEAALSIHGSDQQRQQKRTNKKAESVKQFGLRLFSSLLKKISQKKPSSEIESARKFPTKDSVIHRLKPHETTEEETTETLLKDIIINKVNPEAIPCEIASLAEELKSALSVCSSSSCRSSTAEETVIRNKGETASTEEEFNSETVSIEVFSSSSSPHDADRKPEPSSPAAAEQSTDKGQQRQLFSGESGDSMLVDNDGVKAKKEYDDDHEKQQLSPVSVLDPPFIDHDHEDNHQEEDIAADDMVVEVAESFHFQQSLDLVQRTKDQVMRQIRRFERLAGLNPIELDKLLSEEKQPHTDDVDNDNVDEAPNLNQYNDETERKNWNFGKKDIYEFATELLELPDNCNWERKFPADVVKLISDLIELDSGKDMASTLDLDTLVQRVHGRFEAWKQVSDTQSMELLVNLDFRQEGECWNRFSYEVHEFAAQIELAIVELLISEIMD